MTMHTIVNNQRETHAELNEENIDLSVIYHHLWANKWLIIVTTLISFALAAFYTSKQLPQFQTDVLLQVEDNKKSNSAMGGLYKKLDLASSSENTAATHAALIQSRFILEPVIKALGLDINAAPYRSLIHRILLFPDNKTITVTVFNVSSDYINKPFRLIFEKNNQLRLYNDNGKLEIHGKVGVLSTNLEKSIYLKVSLIHAPINTQFTLVKQSVADIVQKLLKQMTIKDLGGKDNTGILQLLFRSSDPNRIVKILNAIAKEAQYKDAEKKSLEASKALNFLYQQLPLAKHSLQKAETDLNLYRATSGKIDIKLQTQSLLTQLEELDKQLGTLRTNKIDMLQRYTTAHPFLVSLVNQIKALEIKRHQLEKQLKILPASDQIAINLMRDVEVKNSLYLIVLNKIQELEFIKAGTVSNVRILSYAKLPDQPLSDRRGLIYSGSILLGLALSFLIIFVRKLLSPQIDDPHWVERHLNLLNLAIIPYCKEQTVNTQRFNNHTLNHLPLLAHSNPRNLAIESLRSLRTNLQVTLSCAPNNIISILGISPGVGKTFISSNLAWLLAITGKRVLLIDGDIRRGVLHKTFNLQPKPGLVDFLNNTVPIEQVLKESAHPNLIILPRGSYITEPSELLMTDRFKELMQSLSQQFDILIVDTAPVLLVTDGTVIAGLAGTNYLVMGANTHHPTEIIIVMKRLTNAGITLHGSIFNFFNTGSKNRQYYQYGGYYNTDEKEEIFS